MPGDSASETAYLRAARREGFRRALPLSAALMACLLPENWAFQVYLRPDLRHVGAAWTAPLILVAVVGWLRTRGGPERAGEARGWAIATWLGLVLYTLHTVAADQGFGSVAWMGLPISFMAAPLIFPFTVAEIALLAAVGTGGYLAIGFTMGSTPLDTARLAELAFLAQGICVALAAAWVTGRLSRAELLGRLHLQAERERSDRLLENVLPPVIAARLKDGEEPIADRHDEATVLFADVVGFTPLAARLDAEELVQLLNRIFRRFDELAAAEGLEKIKTIGDAYMVAGGIPEARPDHAAATARLALAMHAAVEEENARGDTSLSLRIGLHTGPVVAGVIGLSKFAYDLWGDTVNTASRMESHGEPGTVQVSAATAQALGDAFQVRSRGQMEVKGKGAMEVFVLE